MSDTPSIETPAQARQLPIVNQRYKLLQRIGTGGAGVVFKAVDLKNNNETIALKMFAPLDFKDPTALVRMEKEVQLTHTCEHENIVRTYDFLKTEEGQYFLTMEYVDGGPLTKRIYDKNNPLTFPEILRLLREIATGVGHAHSKGIVHRDLKPDNILLTNTGQAKVADFGLARHMDAGLTITKSADTVGTPYYMAPEQFRNHRVDGRADIYSLGIIAYEMLAHRQPFKNDNYQALAFKHMMEPLPELPKEANVPRWFEIFIGVCAEKKPKHRYQTMEDVVAVLEKKMGKMGLIELPPQSLSLLPLFRKLIRK